MKDERLIVLLDAYLDGALSPAEKTELERMLLESDAARRQFWKRASLHGWAYSVTKLTYSAAPAKAAEQRREIHRTVFDLRDFLVGLMNWKRLAGLAVACLAVMTTWMVLTREPAADLEADEFADMAAPENTRTNAVAMLTRGAGVAWVGKGVEMGELLDPGMLRLESGVVQIETYSGARIILEGPAELELISQQETRLHYGKVSAHVPEQAHGFKVYSGELTVTDLGTEFGVSRALEQPAQVHVFEGKVELGLAGNNQPAQVLTEGQTVEVQREEIRPLPTNTVRFTSENELVRRERAELQARYAAWRQINTAMDADPALLAHFNFENARRGERSLVNRARQPKAVAPATIAGCDWVQGRWPGKGSLEFKQQGDRIQLAAPGRHRAISYMTWVRVDSLPNIYNGLAMADRGRPGEVHWQISRNGLLIFAVRVPVTDKPGEKQTRWERVATSKPLVTGDWFGRWMHLAAVYDGRAKTMSVYANGEVVGTKKLALRQDIILDKLELGNWAHRQSAPGLIRNLNGRMDEFWLFTRPLSAEEIRRQYQLTKPRETQMVAAAPRPASNPKPQ